jgi:hypothetical protein
MCDLDIEKAEQLICHSNLPAHNLLSLMNLLLEVATISASCSSEIEGLLETRKCT